MPAPNVEEIQIPCSLFLGLNTEVAPPDLPEGVSPACQDVAFVPGSVFSRPCLRKVFPAAFPGNPTVVYEKTFVQPDADPLNLYLTSDGNLSYEEILHSPNAYTLLAQVIAGLQAQSVTAAGAEYIAFSDGFRGADVPRQIYRTPDGVLQVDRVSQDGPGAGPTVADYIASAPIIRIELSRTPPTIVTAAAEVGNVVTITTAVAHGYTPNLAVFVFGVGTGYNGLQIVQTVPSATTFTYTVTPTGLGASATGATAPAIGEIEVNSPVNINAGDTIIVTGSGGGLDNNVGGNPPNWQVIAVVVIGATTHIYFSLATASTTLSVTAEFTGTVVLGGQSSPGVHEVVCMFLTRSGYLTAPSPPLQFVSAGNTQWQITNLPIGPPNVVARVLAFTGAGGAKFFTITQSIQFPNLAAANVFLSPFVPPTPQIVIQATAVFDNTSTTAILDVSDNALFGAQGIDVDGNNLFNQVVLGPCLFFFYYASRLLAAGMTNKLDSFLNMGFNGGYLSGALGTPLGWTVVTSGGTLAFVGGANVNTVTTTAVAATGIQNVKVASIAGLQIGYPITVDLGGNQEIVTILAIYDGGGLSPGFQANFTKTHLTNVPAVMVAAPGPCASGMVWQITGDGTNNPRGQLSQAAYQDAYGIAIAKPNTVYSARVWAANPTHALLGSIHVDLYSPSQGLLAQGILPITEFSVAGNFASVDFVAPLPSVIPQDLLLRVCEQGLPVGDTLTLCELELFPTYDPYLSTFLVSYVDNFEAFDGVSGVMGPSADPNPLLGCETIRDQLQFLTSGGMHQVSDNGQEPATWQVAEISNDVGLAAFKALDAGEECIVFVSKSGGGNGAKPTYALRIFEGGQPWKISQEVQTIFDNINSAADQTMWLVNDIGQRRIYIGIPAGTATAPSVLYVLDYREIDTAAQIASNASIHISFSGKMIASDLARKWTIWNIQANCGAMLARSSANVQFCLGAGNGVRPGTQPGFGNVYSLDPQKLTDDDYGAMSPFYTMYFFLSRDTETALGVGSMRKLYKGISEFISWIGSLTITPYAASLTNPWPGPPPMQQLSAPTEDLYHGLNVSTERMAVKFSVAPLVGSTDVQFNLQHVAVRVQQHPMSPFGTGASI